jgi:hypothetical protein
MNYTINAARTAITCHTCGNTSWGHGDIENLYCGACHAFHEGPLPVPPGTLVMWVVYQRPRDLPQFWVARRFLIMPQGAGPTPDHLKARSLGALQELLPAGLARLERHPDDEPQIVEVWV